MNFNANDEDVMNSEQPCGHLYGYIRADREDEKTVSMTEALREFGVPEESIYLDVERIGEDARDDCEALDQLIGKLSDQDTLVVKDIGMIGRDCGEISDHWEVITKDKRAGIVILDNPEISISPGMGERGEETADLIGNVISCMARVSRESERYKRSRAIRNALASGAQKGGRPMKKRPEKFDEVYKMYRCGAITKREAAARYEVDPRTFARWVSNYQLETEAETKSEAGAESEELTAAVTEPVTEPVTGAVTETVRDGVEMEITSI